MNRISQILVFSLVLLSFKSFGNDSTLYHKRVLKVKALFRDLAVLPQLRIQSAADTARVKEYYKKVIKKHINQLERPSNYKLAYSAYTIHAVSGLFPTDSLILSYPDAAKDSLIDPHMFKHYLSNTIIFYLPMYGGDLEGAYFAFKEGTDQMLFFIAAGGEPMDCRRKKEFLNGFGRRPGL